ncbi:Immunoglobulin a1 protease [Coniochaeta hoffmannii]|uniref:Immunoglobulin a1 protease n=1 Tax=Coniochaeta hoffmannii TaxID=91930 RepID=A0AA38REL6_9PEZI|nr:Immunoglobulin a1 protease [Coniochaeta hoffmannii]
MFIFSLLIQPILLLLAGLPPTQPHGVMNKPRPYNYATQPLLQVNPLSGVDFPCQGKFRAEEVTSVTAGESIFVNFTIGTDHHGGSCQFSVTYDDPASADKSKWKVIYTIIGGCPVSSSKGYKEDLPFPYNDGYGRVAIKNCADASDNHIDCIRQFYIPFPKEMPNGNATFAWTWFNNIGNPEMYMNCAPIFITNGAEDATFYHQLPQIFVANIQGECQTNQGILYFPEPGKHGKVLQDTQTGIWYPSTIACGGTSSSPGFETGYIGTMTSVQPSGTSSDAVASTSQEDEDDGSKTGTAPPPKKTCSTDAECSGTDSADGGRASFCDAGVCGCRTSQTPPPPKTQCSSNADCSGPECASGKVQYLCETDFCVCKDFKDPSICTTVETCGYLECKSGQDRACANGKCQCVEKTCSNVDGCGLISCPETQEKACMDGKCRCKDKPPPFESGICNTHIRIYGSESSFAANIIVYDGSGTEIYRISDLYQQHSWGETITLNTGKFPYEMKYEFLDRYLGSNKKRDRPPPGSLGPNPLRYQAYSVRISAGNTVWSTMDQDDARQKVPRCEVGSWDNHGTWDPEKILNDIIQGIVGEGGEHPTRDMDCRWQC